MSDRELNRMLVEKFPELTDEYNEFIEWMGEGEDGYANLLKRKGIEI